MQTMRSHDFIDRDKVESLRIFCKEHNPPIVFSAEMGQTRGDQVKVIAETDVKTMVLYDDYFYLLKTGNKREAYEKIESKPKKWYSFLWQD